MINILLKIYGNCAEIPYPEEENCDLGQKRGKTRAYKEGRKQLPTATTTTTTITIMIIIIIIVIIGVIIVVIKTAGEKLHSLESGKSVGKFTAIFLSNIVKSSSKVK